ncbi:hypothetical protein Gotur_036008 [Gossypium turneri]
MKYLKEYQSRILSHTALLCKQWGTASWNSILSVITSSLMACAKLGILKLERIFHELSVNGFKPDVYTYVIMINGFCEEGLPDEAYQLFRSMGDNDCLPDRRCYNVIIQGFL